MKMRAFWLAGALGATGCLVQWEEETATDRFHFEMERPGRIEVRSQSGPIEVVGRSGNEVQVSVFRRARAHSRRVAAGRLERFSVQAVQQDSTVRVEARLRSAGHLDPGDVEADIEIGAPSQSDLDLFTEEGRIEIDGIEGRIEAETGDGRIHLRDVQGTLRLRSRDGSIAGAGLAGELEASTGDGRIELEGSFSGLRAVTSDGRIRVLCEKALPLTRDWLLRSSDGPIELTLPRDLSADLLASTGDGRVVSELPISSPRRSAGRLEGRLGEGGKLIMVKTSDGRISLRWR